MHQMMMQSDPLGPPPAKDSRPWKIVSIPAYDNRGIPIPGQNREIQVAHADYDVMQTVGRDTRWPLGSAMNPIPPGITRSGSRRYGDVELPEIAPPIDRGNAED